MTFTRVLMTASAIALGLLGLSCTFAPDVVLDRMGAPPTAPLLLIVQVLGALALGHAILNWMGRHSLLGGIYGRPVVLCNMLHFVSAAFAVGKLVARAPVLHGMWPLAVAYALFAAGFTLVLFRHPIRTPSPPVG